VLLPRTFHGQGSAKMAAACPPITLRYDPHTALRLLHRNHQFPPHRARHLYRARNLRRCGVPPILPPTNTSITTPSPFPLPTLGSALFSILPPSPRTAPPPPPGCSFPRAKVGEFLSDRFPGCLALLFAGRDIFGKLRGSGGARVPRRECPVMRLTADPFLHGDR